MFFLFFSSCFFIWFWQGKAKQSVVRRWFWFPILHTLDDRIHTDCFPGAQNKSVTVWDEKDGFNLGGGGELAIIWWFFLYPFFCSSFHRHISTPIISSYHHLSCTTLFGLEIKLSDRDRSKYLLYLDRNIKIWICENNHLNGLVLTFLESSNFSFSLAVPRKPWSLPGT